MNIISVIVNYNTNQSVKPILGLLCKAGLCSGCPLQHLADSESDVLPNRVPKNETVGRTVITTASTGARKIDAWGFGGSRVRWSNITVVY